jgi:hypothetical protein
MATTASLGRSAVDVSCGIAQAEWTRIPRHRLPAHSQETPVRAALRHSLLVAVSAVSLLAGCASAGASETGAPRARQDQQLITRDVIVGTQYTNMFDVVQSLRSNWLRPKTGANASGRADVLVVYLDNQRVGGVDELRRIVPSSVQTARYFDPIAASARWGMDHGAGAIVIVTAK